MISNQSSKKVFRAVAEIRTKFTNEHGHIVQANGDRGDTASRDALFLVFLRWFEIEPQPSDIASLVELRRQSGWVRHPPTSETVQDFVTDPKRFSRDQQTPLVVALGYDEKLWPLFFLTLGEHLYRFGKFQNKDIAAPHFWSLYFAHRTDLLGFLVCFLVDVGWVIEALIANVRALINRKKPLGKKDVSDDVCLCLVLQFRRRVQWTPWIWAAWKIYLLSNPLKSLAIYFRRKTGAPPFARLYWAAVNNWTKNI